MQTFANFDLVLFLATLIQWCGVLGQLVGLMRAVYGPHGYSLLLLTITINYWNKFVFLKKLT